MNMVGHAVNDNRGSPNVFYNTANVGVQLILDFNGNDRLPVFRAENGMQEDLC